MKLRDSLAENNSILLQAEASTWQLLPGHS